jgi:hypothetical protein
VSLGFLFAHRGVRLSRRVAEKEANFGFQW